MTGGAAVAGLAGCTESQADDGGADPGAAGTPTEESHEDGTTHDGEADHGDDGGHEDEGGHDGEEGHEDGEDHEGEETHAGEETHDGEGGHEDEEGGHDDGHGHDHDEGTPQGPSPAAEVAMRTEGNQQHYDPHIAWVETGGTVTWENERGQHNAVAYHPDNDDKPLRMPEGAEPWHTGMLSEEGATASHTFETEGVYDYYCAPHEGVGMVGTVIVGDPDPHDQPALDDPQHSLPDGARRELADLGEQCNEALGHTH